MWLDLIRLKDVIGLHGPDDAPIPLVQLDVTKTDYRSQLKQVSHSSETHIIISLEDHRIVDVLRQASIFNMTDEYWSYLIVSLDAHIIDFARGK